MTDNMSHFLYHQNILAIYTIYTHTKKFNKIYVFIWRQISF